MTLSLQNLISIPARPECPVRGVSKDDKKKDTLRYFFASKKTQGERTRKKQFEIKKIETTCLFLLSIFFHTSFGKPDPKLITFTATDIDNTTKEITISFVVPEKDFLYKDFINCSVHEPSITLSDWKANKQSISYYDPCFNDTKHIFNEDFSISMTATKKDRCHDQIHLYCSYYRKMDNKLNDTFFTFSFAQPLETNIQIHDADIAVAPEEHSFGTLQHTRMVPSAFDKYHSAIGTITAFFIVHHKQCFYVFIMLTALFLLLFNLYQKQLQRHTKFYAIAEMIISLFVVTGITCALSYLYTINKPIGRLLATSISVVFSAITGFFYLKKSTKVSLGFLRTLYTCIGMLCIIATLLLAFKTVQYVDVYMELFP